MILSFFLSLVSIRSEIRNESGSPSTFCRHVPERMDDFAWENDLVAFRAYGPAIAQNKGSENNGVDCWLKRVRYPIIDRWYKRKNYHVDEGEGNDPYHVGSSRGCGGTALWKDGVMIGGGPYKKWQIISQATDHSEFMLTYDYILDGKRVMEEKRIAIDLGRRLFRSESTFTQEGKPLVGLPVAIGITTHEGKASVHLDPAGRWIACWEKIEGFGLGTGVVIEPGFKGEMQELQSQVKDESHAVVVVRTNKEGKTVHHAGYGWEKAQEIRTAEEWQNYLEAFSKALPAERSP